MKLYRAFIFTFALLSATYPLYSYTRPGHIPEDVWQTVTPHLLPENHPMKKNLDKIFCQGKRITVDRGSVEKAGFKNTRPGEFSKAVVTRHRKLPGYIVKFYMDSQSGITDWARLMNRINGAELSRKVIAEHQLGHLFKVPRKWLYPLPEHPAPPAGYQRKNFILIAEDMDLVGPGVNLRLWKGRTVTKELLDATYLLLKKAGLKDSVYAFNIPFSSDGKVAVIDTEYYGMKGIHYLVLCRYLSDLNGDYWKELVSKP